MEKKKDWNYETVERENPFINDLYLDVPTHRKEKNVPLMLLGYEIIDINERIAQPLQVKDGQTGKPIFSDAQIAETLLTFLEVEPNELHDLVYFVGETDANFIAFEDEWKELVKKKNQRISRSRAQTKIMCNAFPERSELYRNIATAYEGVVNELCGLYDNYISNFDITSIPEDVQNMFLHDRYIMGKFFSRLPELYAHGACEVIREIGALSIRKRVRYRGNVKQFLSYLDSQKFPIGIDNFNHQVVNIERDRIRSVCDIYNIPS